MIEKSFLISSNIAELYIKNTEYSIGEDMLAGG